LGLLGISSTGTNYESLITIYFSLIFQLGNWNQAILASSRRAHHDSQTLTASKRRIRLQPKRLSHTVGEASERAATKTRGQGQHRGYLSTNA